MALGTVEGLLRGIAANLVVAYLASILVIYCRLLVLAHMVIVVTIRMFELVILNGDSFHCRYVDFFFCTRLTL